MPIVHRTYTEFDLRAITIQGLSAKPAAPGEKPIGKFGTGIKYAISVLIRNGCSVTIMTPGQRHKIVPQAAEFRGQAYEGLLMRSWDTTKTARPKRTELPYTTHYGSNWELWMAFRELHSNTLDEGGWTKMFNKIPDEHLHVGDGCAIIVEGEAYESEFYNRHKTFFEPESPPRQDAFGVKIYDIDSEYLSEYKYYRGLRAGQTPQDKLMLFVYDVGIECYLSEERQVNDFHWDYHVASAIARSEDEELIRMVLEAEDDYWEASLDFQMNMSPSETFMRVAEVAKVKARHYEFVKAHKPKSVEQLDLEEYPTPWRVVDYAILSANDNVVATRPNQMTKGDFKAVWQDRVAAINAHSPSVVKTEPSPEPDEPAEAPAAPVEGAEEPVSLTDDLAEGGIEDDIPY